MKIKTSLFLWLMAFAVVALMGAPQTAIAAQGDHPAVTMRDAAGAAIASDTTPYSPKQTCGGCHIENCASTTRIISTNTKSWCETDSDKAAYATAHPTAAFADYGSGEKHSVHTQGVIEASGQVYWQSYDVKSFEHGVSIGRHSNQGRNEDYSTAMRSTFGDPFFTSSPGMFGKY